MTKKFIKIRKEQDKLIKACLEEINDYIYEMQDINKDELYEALLIFIQTKLQDLYDYILLIFDIEKYNLGSVSDYLYDKDGKTLKQRIKRWINEYNTLRNKKFFAYHIKLIASHSFRYLVTHLCHEIVIKYNLYRYITIAAGPCEHKSKEYYDPITHQRIVIEYPCEACVSYYGTFLVEEIDEDNLPPFHPGCDCTFWYHDELESEDDPENVDWEPGEDDAIPDNDDLWEEE